ncbi:hypothetical protein HOY80DRAFT_685020 [Tuber brumale]|nr:hypothetical protein HOY80DRAFT_685020 [Tuber brumale]
MPQADPLRYCSEESCHKRLEHFLRVQRKGAAHFYKDDQNPDTLNLSDASARASRLVRSVVEDKLLGADPQIKELAKDLAVLALYDMALLIDDSESMSNEENGQRVEILKGVLKIINDIYQHASEPEIGVRAIRFMNNYNDRDNFLGNPYELIQDHYFGGTTKIGTELHKRILKPLVLGETPMKKPLLVMVITDGAVEGEKKGLLEKVIINCVSKLNDVRPQGADSVAFQFSCIGNDEGARKVLQDLDDHKIVGTYVDCQKATQSLDLSDDRPLTVTKLLLGAIIDKYDDQEGDEELDAIASLDIGDDGGTGGPDFPDTPPNSVRVNSGYSSNQQHYGQQNPSAPGGSNRQNAPNVPMPDGGNGNNDDNTHIPQWLGQDQNQNGFTPEDQSDYHPLAYPLIQPTPPIQNQGAPYPQGNHEGFPRGPEADPNFGPFSPSPSRQHFQDNTSGGYIPGSPNLGQGSYLPHQGQGPPQQHFQDNTSEGHIPRNSDSGQGSYLPHQGQGPPQQHFQNNASGGYIRRNPSPSQGSHLPHQGQDPSQQHFQNNTPGRYSPGNSSPSQGSHLPHQGQGPPQQHFQNNASGGYIRRNSSPSQGPSQQHFQNNTSGGYSPGNPSPSQGSHLPHQGQDPSQQHFQNNTSGGYIRRNSSPSQGPHLPHQGQGTPQQHSQNNTPGGHSPGNWAAEQARRSSSGIGEGRSNMSQSEIDELAEEEED